MSFYPGWNSLESVRFWNVFWEISGIVILGLLVVSEVLAFQYGHRKDFLAAEAEQSRAEEQQRKDKDAEVRRKSEVESLHKQLAEADEKAAKALQQQVPRRLTDQQKQSLTDALSPYGGQKIKIWTIMGDEEAKRFMQDFLSVLDSAAWDHNGPNGILYVNFGADSDPIGVILLVNSTMGNQKRGPAAILPLMETLANFGLVPPETLTRSDDIAPEEIGLLIGRKP